MSLVPGARLGPYEITGAIGAGGMGEVFRARDTKLDRDVAIKVLPAVFAADAERLARFEREAKVLAALHHANIASIYGFEDKDGVLALAMEYVEGEDLAERLKRGPIPPDDAIAIARQIAEALEEAHEKGIVHRDLKPANVKVTPDGQVKVLDFGLAKAWSSEAAGSSPDLSHSPTLAHSGTAAGMILGTAAYMSPEQARGKPVDRRADIWAFGVVLFEMLTGRRLFAGETVSDTLAAVLRQEVDLSVLPPVTKGSVRRLIGRCLERDPRRRLRDIGEARLALEEPGPAIDDPPRSASPSRLPLLAAAAAIAVAAGAAGWAARRSPAPPVRKLDIAADALSGDEAQQASLSPDGRRVAYFAGGKIHVRELDQAEARELPGTEGARYLFWSPDGRAIGFYREEALYKQALGGATPVVIARTGLHVSGAGACWARDGRIVYSRGNTALFEVRAEGGEPRVLLQPDRQAGEDHFHGCSVLPGDVGFLYVVHPTNSPACTIALLAGGRPRNVLTLPGETLADPAWSPTGHIVFARSGGGRDGVWALPFSLGRLKPTGEPFQVVAGAGGPSVGADGSLLYTPGQISRAQSVVWVSREGKIEGTVAEVPDEVGGVALSPDGRRIAVAVTEGGSRNIWAIDVERGTRTRLTPNAGVAGRPAFSADGTQVTFAVNNQVFVVPADGSAPPRLIGPGLQPAFTPDGRALVVHFPNADGRFGIGLLDASGGKERRPVLRDEASVRFPAVSPDGHFLTYLLGDGEAVGNIATGNMMMTRYPDAVGRWQISTSGGDFGAWSPDGRRFYYIARGEKGTLTRKLMEVDVRTTPEVVLGVPRPLFDLQFLGVANAYAVARDGGRFVMILERGGRTIPRLVLVQNWRGEAR